MKPSHIKTLSHAAVLSETSEARQGDYFHKKRLDTGDCHHRQASQRITKDGDHQLQSFPPHLDGTSIHTSD